MKKIFVLLAIASFSVASLAACDVSSSEQPHHRAAVSTPDKPDVTSPPEIARGVFDQVWKQTSAHDRQAMCTGWNTGYKQLLLRAVFDGLGDSYTGLGVTTAQMRTVLIEFFNERCY